METAGVAMSKEYTKPAWIPMKFPERIQLLSRTRKVRSIEAGIGKDIGSRCHISYRRAISQYLPYVKWILEKNPDAGTKLVGWFGFGEEAMEHLGIKQVSREDMATAEKAEPRKARARETSGRQRKKTA
jgi:replication factor C large subunit